MISACFVLICLDDWDKKTVLPNCDKCQHPAIVCHDIVAYLLEHLRLRSVDPDSVAIFKFCIDGGGNSTKYMCMLLTNKDPLLQV